MSSPEPRPQAQDYRTQVRWLLAQGFDELTTKRLGLEFHGPTWLAAHGFPRVQGLTQAVVWSVRDASGQETGKIWARAWWDREHRANNEWIAPRSQSSAVHYPPLIDWDQLEAGARVLLFHDPAAADAVAMSGRPAVAVFGPWGWRDKVRTVDDLRQIPWRDLQLIPVWPFPVAANAQGAAARQCAAMFHVEHGVQLEDSDGNIVANDLEEHLQQLRSEVAIVRELNNLVELRTGNLMSRTEFERVAYADRTVMDGRGELVSVAEQYTKWPGRRVLERIVYAPGKPKITENQFNLWSGFGCEAAEGDVSLYLDWVRDLFQKPDEREYFLNWWAHTVQRPDVKMTQSMIVVGPPGCGKGWITALMTRILGAENVANVPMATVDNRFNAQVATSQLLVIEEADPMAERGYAIYNRLKDLTTNEYVRLERKGVDAFNVANKLNVFISGNRLGIMRIDANDRRFWVSELEDYAQVANSAEYWEPRWAWLDAGGPEAVHHYLKHRDLSQFNAKGAAPWTEAKQDMMDVGRTDEEVFAARLKREPEAVLGELTGYLASGKELVWLMQERSPEAIGKGQVYRLNQALKREGFVLANNGRRMQCHDRFERFFIVRPMPHKGRNWAVMVENRKGWPEWL